MVLVMLFNGGMAWLRKGKKVDGAELIRILISRRLKVERRFKWVGGDPQLPTY